jgi:hypothetical protein
LQRDSPALDRLAVRLRCKLLGTAAILLVVAASPDSWADAQSELEKAHSAYVAHKYDDAEARLRALLDPTKSTLRDPDSIADARMYLGAVVLAEGKKEEAGQVFEQLLLEKPDYQPDPLRVYLDAIDAFIDARARVRDRLAALQAAQVRKALEEKARIAAEQARAATRLAMLEKLASTEVVIERHSRWLAMVPFGVGQFQNGQDTLGWVFLSSEVLLGVASIASASVYLYEQTQANDAVVRHDVQNVAVGYEQRAQLAAIVADSFGGAFFVAGIGGIVHAQLTFVPERIESRKRDIPAISIAPFAGPGLLGVHGRF